MEEQEKVTKSETEVLEKKAIRINPKSPVFVVSIILLVLTIILGIALAFYLNQGTKLEHEVLSSYEKVKKPSNIDFTSYDGDAFKIEYPSEWKSEDLFTTYYFVDESGYPSSNIIVQNNAIGFDQYMKLSVDQIDSGEFLKGTKVIDQNEVEINNKKAGRIRYEADVFGQELIFDGVFIIEDGKLIY
ncbi:MAG: hypothetical protein Q9M91_01665 [Candidatus Dojkabacteria bacterium]|nr:hypothetical protein [Candidatus Dojkabacteria bacterium]